MPKVNQIAVKNPQTGEYEIADISSSASNITFDGGNLSLDAEDVQGAIEEVKGLVDENTSDISTLTTTVSTKSTVSVVSALDSGTEVGTVTVDGTDTVLYAPTPIVPVDVEGNPDDPAEETLTKILIDDVVYGLPNDQGSVVTVDTIQQSGTNIVDIDVDNVTYHIYAPTPPTVIPNDSAPSQTTTPLTNITVNGDTYTTNQVSANPQGTGTDLETISIDGVVYNIPQGSSTVADLEDLDNVTITTPTDGQVLKYNDSTHEWVNAAESGGGSSTLVGLTDTNISSPTADQDLSYDSTSSKWINKTHRVELTKAEYDALPSSKLTDGIEYFITDMETTGTEIVANPQETATDTLTKLQIGDDVYNINGGSAVSDLDDLGDVDITTPTNGQILKYDSTNQVWINANESGGSGGHTILDNSGTALTQRNDLQFVGAYSEDDSTNEITKVNIVREMTKAQYDLLSAAQKKGIIRTTDEPDGGGGGGGSSYSETVLWSGSETPTVVSPYTATLSDSIENYDAIAILCKNNQGDEYYNLPIFLTSEFIIDRHFECSYLAYSPAYDLWRLSNTTISLGLYSSQSSVIYEKVIGIKFGGNSSSPLNYSTTEQRTGQKWIDGKDIYQRTYELNADIPTTGWYSLGIDASSMDFLVDTILYDNGAVFKCYSVAKLDGLIKVEASRKSGGIHANAITIQYTKTT